MKNMILAGMAAVLLMAGCATIKSVEEREKTYGKEAPVITETFASKQLRPGDTLKIYLKASDPGGVLPPIKNGPMLAMEMDPARSCMFLRLGGDKHRFRDPFWCWVCGEERGRQENPGGLGST